MSYNRNWTVQITGEAQRKEVTKLREELKATDKILFNALYEVATKHRSELEAAVNKQLKVKETKKAETAVQRLEKQLAAAKAQVSKKPAEVTATTAGSAEVTKTA